jgi:hypothetical protein
VFSPDPKKDGEARPHYKARIKLTSAELRNVPNHFRLIPGMAVTAEIKAGERTVLSYFLYPLFSWARREHLRAVMSEDASQSVAGTLSRRARVIVHVGREPRQRRSKSVPNDARGRL